MQPTHGKGIRVLIVDGDAINRELAVEILRIGGFDVLCMATGEQALLTLLKERGSIDWLITKIDLPGLVCGWMLADEYRTSDPERPVIFLSDSPADMERRSGSNIVISRHTAAPNILELLKSRNRSFGTVSDGEEHHCRAA